MTTVRDVKASWMRLNDFRTRNSMVTVNAATLSLEDIDRIPEMFAARLKLGEEATRLYEEIGRQICADHGVVWGERPAGVTDDSPISDAAEQKLAAFIAFVEAN